MAYFYSYKQTIGALCLFLTLMLGNTAALAAPKNVTTAPIPAWAKELPLQLQTRVDPDDVSDGYHYMQRSVQ